MESLFKENKDKVKNNQKQNAGWATHLWENPWQILTAAHRSLNQCTLTASRKQPFSKEIQLRNRELNTSVKGWHQHQDTGPVRLITCITLSQLPWRDPLLRSAGGTGGPKESWLWVLLPTTVCVHRLLDLSGSAPHHYSLALCGSLWRETQWVWRMPGKQLQTTFPSQNELLRKLAGRCQGQRLWERSLGEWRWVQGSHGCQWELRGRPE